MAASAQHVWSAAATTTTLAERMDEDARLIRQLKDVVEELDDRSDIPELDCSAGTVAHRIISATNKSLPAMHELFKKLFYGTSPEMFQTMPIPPRKVMRGAGMQQGSVELAFRFLKTHSVQDLDDMSWLLRREWLNKLIDAGRRRLNGKSHYGYAPPYIASPAPSYSYPSSYYNSANVGSSSRKRPRSPSTSSEQTRFEDDSDDSGFEDEDMDVDVKPGIVSEAESSSDEEFLAPRRTTTSSPSKSKRRKPLAPTASTGGSIGKRVKREKSLKREYSAKPPGKRDPEPVAKRARSATVGPRSRSRAPSTKPRAQSVKPRATSVKPRATSVKPRATSVKPRATSVRPTATGSSKSSPVRKGKKYLYVKGSSAEKTKTLGPGAVVLCQAPGFGTYRFAAIVYDHKKLVFLDAAKTNNPSEKRSNSLLVRLLPVEEWLWRKPTEVTQTTEKELQDLLDTESKYKVPVEKNNRKVLKEGVKCAMDEANRLYWYLTHQRVCPDCRGMFYMEDGYFQCSLCEAAWHKDCAKLSESEVNLWDEKDESKQVPWYCPSCRGDNEQEDED